MLFYMTQQDILVQKRYIYSVNIKVKYPKFVIRYLAILASSERDYKWPDDQLILPAGQRIQGVCNRKVVLLPVQEVVTIFI